MKMVAGAEMSPASLRYPPRAAAAAPVAGLALDRQLAAVALDDLGADREPEAGTAVFAGDRGIGLDKAIEQPGELVLRYPDTGIADRHTNPCITILTLFGINLDADPALIGEFDCISNQVHQDLAYTPRIATKDATTVGGELTGYLQLLGVDLRTQNIDHASAQTGNRKIRLF